jgi:hypothetical protein
VVDVSRDEPDSPALGEKPPPVARSCLISSIEMPVGIGEIVAPMLPTVINSRFPSDVAGSESECEDIAVC